MTASAEELLEAVSHRAPLAATDGKSGARLERVTVAGRSYVLKHLGVEDDWVARASGDLACRPVVLWRSGLLDALPDCLDHAIVVCTGRRSGRGGVVLMRDVGPWLVPVGDAPLPMWQHRKFLDHMAALHAAFWGFEDTVGLLPLATRYLLLSPWVAEAERRRAVPAPVPSQLAPAGWRRLAVLAPRAHAIVAGLFTKPDRLVRALAETPATLVHGDWKAGNLGTAPEGRTVLLDWAVPGAAPGCVDLAHYLCLNASRLAEPKEEAIAAYRRSLEARGIDTTEWWDRQLDLCLLGAFVMFGWEKALGARHELDWWEQRAIVATRWLPSPGRSFNPSAIRQRGDIRA